MSAAPPSASRAAARAGFARCADLYLAPPLSALFGQRNPATRDAKLVGEKLAELSTRGFVAKVQDEMGAAMTQMMKLSGR